MVTSVVRSTPDVTIYSQYANIGPRLEPEQMLAAGEESVEMSLGLPDHFALGI